jgi:glutathione synthase/RimK-type ligase-like ATP-grasp enzyme
MFVLYHKSTSVTGRAIAKALGIKYGRENKTRTPMIRWGSAIEHPAETLLNSRQAILRASDKLTALKLMQDAGVSVPSFLPGGTHRRQEGVWLGRRRHGSQGRDIRVIERGELSGSELYTRYVPNTREYRVHVFRGEVIRVQGKYHDHPEQQTNRYIKNHAQGYRFRAPDRKLNTERTSQAIRAVECLGLDFGAVDLLIGEDRRTYVLEVNTAPSCSPLTAAKYVAKFAEVLNLRPNFARLGVLAVDTEE